MKNFAIFVWETTKIVVISLAIIIPIRYFLIQPFFVRGASMEPNFDSGQYLVVDELSYRFQNPNRGDVIVFEYPLDPSQYYIKRIIGLPRETVEIKDGNIIIYNIENPKGFILDESSYLSKEDSYTNNSLKMTLDSGEYFVLGDNRNASSDSRRWGPVSEDEIVGKVWIRAWPFDSAKIY